MHTAKAAESAPFDETGTLIFKNHCYALRRTDGAEMWLELDRSPVHLLDRPVRIQGKFYSRHSLIVADRVNPC